MEVGCRVVRSNPDIAAVGVKHYVVDVFRARVNPVELREAVLRLITQYKPRKILIENASSGVSLQAMLKEKNHPAELLPTRGQTKEERLESVLHYFVEGRVFVKASEPWSVELVNEWMRFPVGRHDDQVDAMSQYLAWRLENPPRQFYLARGGTSEDRAAVKIFGPPPPKRDESHASPTVDEVSSPLRRRPNGRRPCFPLPSPER